MVCKHCGHGPTDHLDRAIVACAPEMSTVESAIKPGRFPKAKFCACPGWETA